jgi:predicted RNA-binding protein with PIN domain
MEDVWVRVLVVDGANVVGATPDGWWRDRPGAAARLAHRLLVADLPYDEVVLVLEGQAKGGVGAGRDLHLRVVHAPRDGDSAISAEARAGVAAGNAIEVVTADRLLRTTVEVAGADVRSPRWLLDHLD